MSNSRQDFIWAALFHMGSNMWDDYKALDHVQFDEKVWRTLTGRMVEVGMNMVVIDLGEAIRYPSHPEIAVKGRDRKSTRLNSSHKHRSRMPSSA